MEKLILILTSLAHAFVLTGGDHHSSYRPLLAIPQVKIGANVGFGNGIGSLTHSVSPISKKVPIVPSVSGSASFRFHGHSPNLPLEASLEEPNYIQAQMKNLVPISVENLIEEEWKAFKMTYNKIYASADIESFRREVFIENRAKIARFNQEYAEGKRNFVQQLNPYGDLLHHEFTELLNGFNRSTLPRARLPTPTTYIPSANVVLPTTVDWRHVGAVTPVKSQGGCASCWAFAAAGALEGHWFRKTGELVDVSEQNLVDCTKSYGNDGCGGGLIDPAFQYIRANGGVDGEESYPYEGVDGECRFKPENVVVQCTGYVDIAEGDEKGLEIAVATLGPVAVAIDASKDGLQFYSDGVYYDPTCGNTQDDMNHAVLVVGYGQEPNGQKYWLVKNSYGPQWGLGGYIKMAKDANNHCGIANQASYPLV